MLKHSIPEFVLGLIKLISILFDIPKRGFFCFFFAKSVAFILNGGSTITASI